MSILTITAAAGTLWGSCQTIVFHLQKNASPSAEELEHLRSKLLRADLELSSVSEQHQKEYKLARHF